MPNIADLFLQAALQDLNSAAQWLGAEASAHPWQTAGVTAALAILLALRLIPRRRRS